MFNNNLQQIENNLFTIINSNNKTTTTTPKIKIKKKMTKKKKPKKQKSNRALQWFALASYDMLGGKII